MNWAEALYIKSALRSRRLQQGVAPKLIELGGRVDGLSALDVGCGPGQCVACEVDLFGAADVTAIDLDPSMVAVARRRLGHYGDRVTVTDGDVTQLEFPDGRFDAVFNFAVLHHVEDWRQALREIVRVLGPDGRFFSQDHDVANHDWLSRRLFHHPADRFTNQGFLDEIRIAGLDVLRVEDKPEQLLVVARKRP